jgi:hypothetical protein
MFRRKPRSPHLLRYLVYVSDTKIDMLLEQIPERVLRTLATELKLDLKLLSLTMSRSVPPNETRSSRLAVVEHHLELNHRLGDLDTRASYVRAAADMDWAVVDDGIVLFVGRVGQRLVVLGGSASNLVGGGHLAPGLGSHSYAITRALNSFTSDDAPPGADFSGQVTALFERVYRMPQRVSFVARRMTEGQVDQPSIYQSFVVASPLFVELLNEED